MRTQPRERVVFKRLAYALRKLTNSASQNIGADCLMQALLAQQILKEEGLDTKVVLGEAAWRIGPDDGDVITHSPTTGGFAPVGIKAMAYHAWLEWGTSIIDFTTHSLRVKAAQLDALDGGKTNVHWCPSYLFIPKRHARSLGEVTQALDAGVACYREIPGLHMAMLVNGHIRPVDQEDLCALRLLYQNPRMVVIGPNDQPEKLRRLQFMPLTE